MAVIFGALPADQQTAILELLGIGPERIPAIMGLAVIVARLIAQPKAQALGIAFWAILNAAASSSTLSMPQAMIRWVPIKSFVESLKNMAPI